MLMLCLAMVHVGTPHSLPNVMFQAENVAPRPSTQKCGGKELFNYLESLLPDRVQCAMSTIDLIVNDYSLTDELQRAYVLTHFCKKDCRGAFLYFLEFTCNDQQTAEILKMACNYQMI